MQSASPFRGRVLQGSDLLMPECEVSKSTRIDYAVCSNYFATLANRADLRPAQFRSAGGEILFIVVLKRSLKEHDQSHAQFFSALLCTSPSTSPWDHSFILDLAAAECNVTTQHVGSQRVYGLFTDVNDFVFYSFCPMEKRFAFDSQFSLWGTSRERSISMIPGERSP
jgi:hypothetical protein